MFLVSARRGKAPAGAGSTPIALEKLAETPLAIPSRPHSIRMLVETVLANAGRRATVALEVESIPVILDLVQQGDVHAVLTHNAIRSSGLEAAFQMRPIGKPPLTTTLWMATSAQRPRGPLIEQGSALVRELLLDLWD